MGTAAAHRRRLLTLLPRSLVTIRVGTPAARSAISPSGVGARSSPRRTSGAGCQSKATAVVQRTDATLVVRRVWTVAATVAVTVLLMSAAPSANLRQLVPTFMLVLFLYFAPALWIRDPDLFSPLVFSSLMTGLALAASFVGFFYTGDVRLGLAITHDPSHELDLVSRVLLLLGLSQLSYLVGYRVRLGDYT